METLSSLSDDDESENDDVNKEKVAEPYNPYIKYYLNQALTGQTYFNILMCTPIGRSKYEMKLI